MFNNIIKLVGIKMKKVKYVLNEVGERPWGMWKCISVGEKYISKIITVKPRSSLSLQSHNYRQEHWVVIKGNPVVTLGNIKKEYTFGQSIDIPVKTKHRLENLTDDFVEILEIQMGDVLDEDDIIRFEDAYNRV